MRHKISTVVAAYNEEPVIRDTIYGIISHLESQAGYDWELICVDDGSRDRTFSVMKEAAGNDPRIKVLGHLRNMGQGKALRTGFEACSGDIVVTMDADLSYGPQYITSLSEALDKERADIALTSPYTKGGAALNVPFYRHFLSRYGNKYLSRMSNYKNLSTSTSVVRAYRREVLDSLFLTSDGMELQLEILMKSAMMGYRVFEIPARLIWRKQKKEDAKFRRVSKMKIMKTIRLYLFMGWLAKPALIFLILALFLLMPGLYMVAMLFYRVVSEVIANSGRGISAAVSEGLETVFRKYTYSFVVSGGLIIFGFQLLVFALLTLQNKFYFEELYRLGLRPTQNGRVTGVDPERAKTEALQKNQDPPHDIKLPSL